MPAPRISSGVQKQPDRSWLVPAALILMGGLCITLLAIVLSSHVQTRTGSGFSDDERAWEIANHDQIIALKSAAEAFAIQGKLPEAHAKYRELEQLLGGRTVKDAQLFDLIAQARQDQDRIYSLILQRMAQQQAGGSPGASAPVGGLPPGEEAPPPMPQSAPAPVPGTSPVPPERQAIETPPTTEPTTSAAPVGSGASSALAAEKNPSLPPGITADPVPAAPGSGARSHRVTDAEVGQAIQGGVNFLISQFKDGHIVAADANNREAAGVNALAVYALLQSSRAIRDPRLAIKGPFLEQALNYLRDDKMETSGDLQAPITYSRSLRACALATYNRGQDRKQLQDDVKWLIRAANQGAYTYDDRFTVRIPQSQGGYEPRSDRIEGFDPNDGSKKAALDPDDAARRFLARLRQTQWDHAKHENPVQLLGSAVPGGARAILADGVHGPDGREIAAPSAPAIPWSVTPPPTFSNTLPPHPYTAPPKYRTPFPWDNSNSQYGLLGVWAGAEVGCEVPVKYWHDVERHWQSCQKQTGQWNYNGDGSRGYFAMSVAGIASLLVTHDYIDGPLLGKSVSGVRNPYGPPLSAGLAWLESGDNSIHITDPPLFYRGYSLFGLERVGLACGFKYFGEHDWFAELAASVLPTQYANGAFGQTDQGKHAIIDTAYTLLFLSRGRHPILMNKLRYDGNWTNRPRDVANLAKFATSELERQLNWQVVDIDRSPDDWADAPILFISGNHPPKLTAEQEQKIAAYVEAGGLLFTHSDLDSEAFNGWAAQLAKKLWPEFPLKELPADSPVYTLNYEIKKPRPRLLGVSNGVRLLMVHSPRDLGNAWQLSATVSRSEAFKLGVNLFLYAIGKEQFRNRLDTRAVPVPAPDSPPPSKKIYLARIEYNGYWAGERMSWIRLSQELRNDTGVDLVVMSEPAKNLDPGKYRIATLTGQGNFVPPDSDLPAVRNFIEQGGILIVDSWGGNREFAGAIQAWLNKLGSGATTAPTNGPGANTPSAPGFLQPIEPTDPLLHAGGPGQGDLSKEKLRLYALTQLGGSGGAMHIETMKLGKGRVIFTPLDLCSGLLGTDTWGILGYLPEYSEGLARNLVAEAGR
jgi:hypothetical protein